MPLAESGFALDLGPREGSARLASASASRPREDWGSGSRTDVWIRAAGLAFLASVASSAVCLAGPLTGPLTGPLAGTFAAATDAGTAGASPATDPAQSGFVQSGGACAASSSDIGGAAARSGLILETTVLDEWTLFACRTGQEPAAVAEALCHGGAETWELRLASLVEAAAAAAASPDGEAHWRDTDLFGCVRRAAIPCGGAARQALIGAIDELALLAPTPAEAVRFATLACRLAESLPGEVDDPERGGSTSMPDTFALGSIERRVEFITALSGSNPEALIRQLRARTRALALGSRAPAFVGRDTDGNEVRSDSFLGQIVVYRFWKDDCPASIAAHEHDLALLRAHWNAPVELVGVSRNADRAQHLERLDQTRIGGTQVFEGPISTHLADALARRSDLRPLAVDHGTEILGARAAFVEPGPGSLVVVDSRGVIRGRDLAHTELDELLVQLIAEHRASLRGRITAPLRSASSGQ